MAAMVSTGSVLRCLQTPQGLSFSQPQAQPSQKASFAPSVRFSHQKTRGIRAPAVCSASPTDEETSTAFDGKRLASVLCGACAAVILVLPSYAAPLPQVRLPPLSRDPLRCERAFVGNTIGQANGVADKLLDLRQCDFSNNKTDLKGKTLSAALMSEANFDGADMTEVIMSKAYAVGASFKGTDFTSAVLDRVAFDGADLSGVKFYNTVLSGSTFVGAQLADADFEDALIGYVDVQKLCRNPTLNENSRYQVGCPQK